MDKVNAPAPQRAGTEREVEVAGLMRSLDLLRIADADGFAEVIAMIAAATSEMERRKKSRAVV